MYSLFIYILNPFYSYLLLVIFYQHLVIVLHFYPKIRQQEVDIVNEDLIQN